MRGGYPSKLQRNAVGCASEGSACLRDLPTPAEAGASRRREPLRRRQARRSLWRSTGFSPWGSTSESSLWQGAEGSAPGHFQVSTPFTAFEITKILRLLLSSSRGTIKKPSLSRVYPWVVPIKVSPSRKVIFTFI
jgi:hypothetical protein